jgi:SAM-dependent methyltransferase
MAKPEIRLVPEEKPLKFYMEHLKPYEFVGKRVLGARVLDIGGGDGYGPAYLARRAAEVVSIDYIEDAVAKAEKKYQLPNLVFMCMDATQLFFEDNSFDYACSFQVIEHIPEEKLIKYLTEIKRVLKDGGEFILSTLNLDHVMKSPLTYEKSPAHCKEFKLHELKELLSKVFEDVEMQGLTITPKHRFYQRLKKIGIFNFLPAAINPVSRFYGKVSTADFKITPEKVEKASDFVCICKK